MSNPNPKQQYYVVAVVRGGVRRTSTLPHDQARETVHDAVRLGYEVSCRPMTDKDPIILGVREEQL
jgi:hypothetical protein